MPVIGNKIDEISANVTATVKKIEKPSEKVIEFPSEGPQALP